MKTLNFKYFANAAILTVLALVMNSCVTSSTYVYDDIYADDNEIATRERMYQTQDYQQYDDYSSQAVTGDTLDDEFNMDDYYDYAYTARLHRFHNPAPIYGYYDDYYTNLYWYDYNPYSWGTSIYFGYSWWWPHASISWGWEYYPWRYGWYGDRYGWYNYAYAPRYWWYYDWRYPWYYNSRDRNSNFYRPSDGSGRIARTESGRNSSPGYRGEPTTSSKANNYNGQRTIKRNSDNLTFGDKYNARFGSNKLTRSNNNSITRSQKPINRMGNDNNRSNSKVNTRRSYTPAAAQQQRSSNVFRSNSNTRSIPQRRTNSIKRNNNNSSRSFSTPSRSGSNSRSFGSSHSGSGGGRIRR